MPDRPEAYEILIRLDQRVDDLHTNLLGPSGRLPKIEDTVEEHSAQLHQWTGSVKVGTWILGALITIFGGILAEHILTEQHNAVVAPAPESGMRH